MIKNKVIVGLLFGVALIASSMSLMSSQADRIAFKAELIKANKLVSSKSATIAQMETAYNKLEELAGKIRSTNVSSIGSTVRIDYSDLMGQMRARVLEIQSDDIAKLGRELVALRSVPGGANPADLARVKSELDDALDVIDTLKMYGGYDKLDLVRLEAEIRTLKTKLGEAESRAGTGTGGGMSARELQQLTNALMKNPESLVDELSDGSLPEASLETVLNALKAPGLDASQIYNFASKMGNAYQKINPVSLTIGTKIVATVDRLLRSISTYEFPNNEENALTVVNDILQTNFNLNFQFKLEGAPKEKVTKANYLNLLTQEYVTDAALKDAGYNTADFVDVIQGASLSANDVFGLTILVQHMYDIYTRHESLQGNVQARMAFVMDMGLVKGFKYAEKQATDLNKQLEAMGLEPVEAAAPLAVVPVAPPAPPAAPPVPPVAKPAPPATLPAVVLAVPPVPQAQPQTSAWTLDTATDKIIEISKIKKNTALTTMQIDNLKGIYTYLISVKNDSDLSWKKAVIELNAVLTVRRKTKEVILTLIGVK